MTHRLAAAFRPWLSLALVCGGFSLHPAFLRTAGALALRRDLPLEALQIVLEDELSRDRLALERMRVVDTVLFDKTGTLTRGAHVVTGVAAATGHDEATVLRLAAAAEADSEHPLARAIAIALWKAR